MVENVLGLNQVNITLHDVRFAVPNVREFGDPKIPSDRVKVSATRVTKICSAFLPTNVTKRPNDEMKNAIYAESVHGETGKNTLY